MDFIVQYDLVSRDFNLSHHKKRQCVHDLFRVEALRCYCAEVVPQEKINADVVAKMKSQFSSIGKQQCVIVKSSGLLFKYMVQKFDGDRRKAFRELVVLIESRIPLCTRYMRNESSKVDFIQNMLLKEDWARQNLYNIGKGTHFCELQTQLACALQVHGEVQARSGISSGAGPSTSSESKPTIFLTVPKYAKRVTKILFPESDQDRSCWNCKRTGHRHICCRKLLNHAAVAARKAEFLEKKNSATVSSMYSTHWCKDLKTSSTSSQPRPKL